MPCDAHRLQESASPSAMIEVLCAQDAAGSGMKDRKKHWNTFSTAYFMTLALVRATLQAAGRLNIIKAQALQYLEAPLACHRCRAPCRTMPELLAHISGCSVALPA